MRPAWGRSAGAVGVVLFWVTSFATFVAVIVGPAPSVRLTNDNLSGEGNVVPRHTIRDISLEKMEHFTHVYAETSQGRFCVWSHRDATRCAMLVVQLKRELDRIQRLQGSPDDIPAALSGLRAHVRSQPLRGRLPAPAPGLERDADDD